jgi:lipid A disaccharide synthetase
LIAGKQVVEELIKGDFTTEKTAISLSSILSGNTRAEVLMGYEGLRQQLGPSGCAERAADFIVAALQKPKR